VLPGAAAVEVLSPAAAGAGAVELLSVVADVAAASVVAPVAAVLLAVSLLVLLQELRASRQAPSRGKVERSIVLGKRFGRK